MPSVVFDSNVLVSGLLKRHRGGVPDQIIRQPEKYELHLAEEILSETRRVLHYPRIQKKAQLSEEEIDEYLDDLRSIATLHTNLPDVDVIAADPDDNLILACALAADADYIISGDPHLTDLGEYEDIQVIRPAAFLEMLKTSGASEEGDDND